MKILYAEDSYGFRETVVELFSKFGFDIREADNAESAIQLLESGELFDLLLTDNLMGPGKTGQMLAIWIKERFPKMPVVMLAGWNYPHAPLAVDFLMQKNEFNHKELAAKIRELIEKAKS